MKLYLICGKAGVGKDTFGAILKNEYEKRKKKVCLLKITAPLYFYAREYFGWDGKEENKPRTFLQNMGIEIIKKKLDMPFFLVDRLKDDIKILSDYFDVGIITDGRLKEELDQLRKSYPYMKIIHLSRKDCADTLSVEEKKHITERDLDQGYSYDYDFVNGSEESLSKIAQFIILKEEGSDVCE